MSKSYKIGIIGGGGFTGKELLKLLIVHPLAQISYITSDVYTSQNLSSVFPELKLGKFDITFSHNPKVNTDIPKDIDIMFLACPDNVAMQWVNTLITNKTKVIDLGGSFRLSNSTIFEKYYKIEHTVPNLISSSVYGLSEIYRDTIKKSNLIANPGCYPTSVLIPLALISKCLEKSITAIIIDSKSGTSGAGGRKEKDELSFSNVYENFRAYKVSDHQHTPEIQEFIYRFINKEIPLKFTPHLLPVFRGILSTIYVTVNDSFNEEELQNIIQEKIKNLIFVRYYQNPNHIQLNLVQNTNFIDFSYSFDKQNKILTIISVIDNLIKGAAGQAIQNMNIMLDIDETTSLV